jgi:hypothetical protein
VVVRGGQALLGSRDLGRANSGNDWLSSDKGSGWIFLRGVVYSCLFAGFLSNGLLFRVVLFVLRGPSACSCKV